MCEKLHIWTNYRGMFPWNFCKCANFVRGRHQSPPSLQFGLKLSEDCIILIGVFTSLAITGEGINVGKKIPLPELPEDVSSWPSPTSSTAKRAEVDISTNLLHYYSPLASDFAVHYLHKSKWTLRKTTLFHLNKAVKMWKDGSRHKMSIAGSEYKGTATKQGDGNKGTDPRMAKKVTRCL